MDTLDCTPAVNPYEQTFTVKTRHKLQLKVSKVKSVSHEFNKKQATAQRNKSNQLEQRSNPERSGLQRPGLCQVLWFQGFRSAQHIYREGPLVQLVDKCLAQQHLGCWKTSCQDLKMSFLKYSYSLILQHSFYVINKCFTLHLKIHSELNLVPLDVGRLSCSQPTGIISKLQSLWRSPVQCWFTGGIWRYSYF